MSTTSDNSKDLTIPQGNTRDVFCAVVDGSDNVFDISGYVCTLYAKEYNDWNNSTIDITVDGSIYNASQGAVVFEFSQTDTSIAAKDYSYEIIIDGSGNYVSVVQDRLTITESVRP